MRNTLFSLFTWCLCWPVILIAEGQTYQEASLDQATRESICSLKIERYEPLDEEGMEAEYRWALGMAVLCLSNPHAIQDRESCTSYAIDYQRHAGRTARYRGYGIRAIEDYETALAYLYEVAPYFEEPERRIPRWEATIWRDIADTYLLVGALSDAADVSGWILDQMQQRGESPPGGSTELYRLAFIAEIEGRSEECLRLARQIVEWDESQLDAGLAEYPNLLELSSGQSWYLTVRLPDYEHLRARLRSAKQPGLNAIRAAHCFLGRALRVNGRLGDAEEALETATRTPWRCEGTCRDKLDFEVDREWAFLALAKGEAGEALGKAEYCLDKYVMRPAEEIELLDLVSQAKEALGDVAGAMEALEAAIEIVETRRANLVADEFKQSYAAGYAELYRRALDLSLLRNADFGLRNGREPEAIPTEYESPATSHETPATSDASRFTNDEGRPAGTPAATHQRPAGAPAATAFQWAERVKGRAMLDAINRYDRRMERAIAGGHTEKMKIVRKQMRQVVSVEQLQNAEWWPSDTALIEYAFGANGAVYVWVVSRSDATFQKLRANATQIDDECAKLSTALRQHGDAWVEPAAKLYEHTIRPIADRLKGIEKLVVVGDGKLRTVPFEVFISSPNANERRYIKHRLLIEDYAISYAPSATTLQAISAKTERGDSGYTDSLWAFASTKFGSANVETEGSRSREVEESSEALHPKPEARSLKPEAHRANDEPRITNHEPRITSFRDILRDARSITLNDLPNTGREVERIAGLFPQGAAKTWINQENMKQVLLSASDEGTLKSVRFLHFATHAFVDESRPYLCGLVLSPPFPNATDAEPRSLTRPSGRSPPSLTSACQGRARCAGGGVSRISPRGSSSGENARHGEGPRPGAPGKLTVREESGSSAHRALRDAEAQLPAKATLDRLLRRSPSDGTRGELLTLHELAGLDLGCELVALSACQSLGGRAIEGDWINGLARSFLIAGSSGVLCTLWDTGDKTSSTVVPAIYHAILDTESAPGRIDVPWTLQQHKISTLNSRQHGHPAHWAPFIYHGRIGCEGQKGK